MSALSYWSEVAVWTAVVVAWPPLLLAAICGWCKRRYPGSPSATYRLALIALCSVPATYVVAAAAVQRSLERNAAQGSRGALEIQASHFIYTLGSSLNSLSNWLTLLAIIWMAGALAQLTRIAFAHVRVMRLCGRATRAPQSLVSDVRLKARAIGLAKFPEVLIHDEIAIPFVTGGGRPVLALPATVGQGPESEAIILHELAHLRRHDYSVNLLIQLIAALFWFHPAVRWLAESASQAREECCDDDAVSCLSSPLVLAHALVGLADRQVHHAVAIGAGGGSLLKRVSRLTEHQPIINSGGGSFIVAWKLAIAAMCAVAVLGAWTFAPTCDRLVVDGAASGRLPSARTIIRAIDPAGPFTVALVNGRVGDVEIGGVLVPRKSVVVTENRLTIRAEPKSKSLSVEVDPRGGISWEPRSQVDR